MAMIMVRRRAWSNGAGDGGDDGRAAVMAMTMLSINDEIRNT